jgi:hypothetical protein
MLTAYGACNVIAFGDGPFYIFSRLREFANNISSHFGKLFSCMMCLPANFGLICSLFNWFLIPIKFTPFNMIFAGCCDLWWLAALCDGAFTTGIVYLIYIINEYIEKQIDYYEQNTIIDENNIDGYDYADEKFEVDDITKKEYSYNE